MPSRRRRSHVETESRCRRGQSFKKHSPLDGGYVPPATSSRTAAASILIVALGSSRKGPLKIEFTLHRFRRSDTHETCPLRPPADGEREIIGEKEMAGTGAGRLPEVRALRTTPVSANLRTRRRSATRRGRAYEVVNVLAGTRLQARRREMPSRTYRRGTAPMARRRGTASSDASASNAVE